MEERRSVLLTEWSQRNEKPITQYGPGSPHRAWWICSVCSHEWQTSIHNRNRKGSNCPECRKLKVRGSNNVAWNGYGEISGAMWCRIQKESTFERKNRRYKSYGAPAFEITIEYAWQLFLEQDRKCALSGRPLMMWGKIDGKYQGTASLDRIDSSKGYIIGNVQWIHKELQHAKRNQTDKAFIKMCIDVAMHQTKKKVDTFMPPSFKQWTERSV